MKLIVGLIAAAVILAMVAAGSAGAGPLQDGTTAFQRHDYVKAVRLLGPLAQRGNSQAQTYLGLMYEYGRGVPQNYVEAWHWYCLAAEQGHAYGQYLLGLVYDKGLGVERDYVQAHKWLSLAAAHAPRNDREYWIRIRDSVASKMTFEDIALAQRLAVEWRPRRLKPVAIGKASVAAPAVVIEAK